jgi:hypothetical protein
MGLYVISGCPRSGTSLMMSCFRSALGAERILGEEFPRDYQRKTLEDSSPIEVYRKHLREIVGSSEEEDDENQEHAHDMNPEGFWEDHRFSVKGLRYSKKLSNLIRDIMTGGKPYTAKIVSQGLGKTDPVYVEKLIVMVRHPRAVAKSQEKLRREKYKDQDGKLIDFNQEKIHTPQMFIGVSIQLCAWLTDNPQVPCLLVDFDDLIEDPYSQLKRVQEFIGEGDFEAAVGNIKPELRRSYPENVANTLWGEAEHTYKLLKERDFKGVYEYFEDPKRNFNRETRNWICTRYMAGVVENHCRVCKASQNFRETLREFAEQQGIPWRDRPCVYETTFDLDNPLISMEESVANNFWEAQHESNRSNPSPRGDSRSQRLSRHYRAATLSCPRAQHRS